MGVLVVSAKKRKQPQNQQNECQASQIMHSAWEHGAASLPEPMPQANNVDDITADLALTGEIPLDLIREILRRQEQEAAMRKTAHSTSEMIRPEEIVPREKTKAARAEFARDNTPTRVEIEAAKQELRAMKARSALPQEQMKAKTKETQKKKLPKQPKAPRQPRFRWAAPTNSEELYQIPLGEMATALYRNIYYFGLRFARPVLRFGRFAKPYVLHPIMALGHIIRAVLLLVHHVTTGRIQRAFTRAHEQYQTHKQLGAVRGLRTLLQGYRLIIRSAINVAMPVAAALVLLLVIQSVSNGQTYALRVTFNDVVLGYAASESDFARALAAASDHMQPVARNGNGNGNSNGNENDNGNGGIGIEAYQALAVEENLQMFAQFELTRVSPENLTPPDILTDRLLEHSPHEMASGSGVFVDGYLVATIRNSSDAESVLNSIVTEQTAALDLDIRTTDTVEFIQDIDIVPGFYPAEQMIDAQALMHTLAGDEYEDTMLEVMVVRTETRRVPVSYDSIDTNNYNLFQGEVRIRVRGVPGEEEIVERVTYVNGARVGTPEEISRTRVREPQPQRREVGRRSTRVNPGGTGYVTINPSTQGFVWPVPSVRRISSPFGMRRGRMHNGIDIANGRANGAVVVASRSGTVTRVAWQNSWGNYILIDHGGGIQTRYAHLMTGSASVSRGQRVETGQPIARVGSTGNSTGPHLHFEVIVNGRPQNPLNFVSINN